MLIGGIWHGAGWTFVIWGALHGLYLLIYHAWRDSRDKFQTSKEQEQQSQFSILVSRAFTFLVVTLAWIFFRAETFDAAMNLLVSLTGTHGFMSNWSRVSMSAGWCKVGALLLVVWILPNTNQLLARFQPTLEYLGQPTTSLSPASPRWAQKLAWVPRRAWAFGIGALAVVSVLGLSRISEFIYWQF